MPYKSARKSRAYQKRWRKRHKGYHAAYGRLYRGPGKKELAMMAPGSNESLIHPCHLS